MVKRSVLPTTASGVRLPTTRTDWRLLARTIRLVLSIPAYAALAGLITGLALTGFVVTQNLELVVFTLTGGLPLPNRLTILLALYPFLGTTYSGLTGVAVLVVAGLVGVDLALVAFYVREHRLAVPESSGSAVGITLGLLGAGCAACGSTILAGIFSLLGATSLLALLPFEGLEFSGLAGLALLLSMFWLADGMRGGSVRGCPIEFREESTPVE